MTTSYPLDFHLDEDPAIGRSLTSSATNDPVSLVPKEELRPWISPSLRMGDHIANMVRRSEGSIKVKDGDHALEQTLTWIYWSDKLSTGSSPFVVTRAMPNPCPGPELIPHFGDTPATLELSVTLCGPNALSIMDDESRRDFVRHSLRQLQLDDGLLQTRCWQIPHQAEEFYRATSTAHLEEHGVTYATYHGVKSISIDLSIKLHLSAREAEAASSGVQAKPSWPADSDFGQKYLYPPDPGEQLTMLLDLEQSRTDRGAV